MSGGGSFLQNLAELFRRLLGRKTPPTSPFVKPFVGQYRTRPHEPPPPPPKEAPSLHRRADRSVPVFLVLSLAFVAAGVWMGVAGRGEKDKLWAAATVAFFGLCSWVFGEQLVARDKWLAAHPGAIVRMALVLTASGSAGAYAAWVYERAPISDRIGIGAFGLAFVGLAAWVIGAAIKAGRLKLRFKSKTQLGKRR
ncbi:MAG: hypothetical protein IPK82_09115 [Polyangiaceae bacterium]|nr:hypothetical protein [Polyangiaceae bacterium]